MPQTAITRLTIRFDSRTAAELAALAAHFSEHVAGSTPSDVVRTAIRELYRQYADRLDASKGKS